MTEFFMPMIPPTITHQQKRISHIKDSAGKDKMVMWEEPDLKEARAKLTAHLGKNVPKEKYTSGVRLITKWCFPVCAKHKDGEYRTSKPDTDNLQKLLKDVMTNVGFWTDDALIASEVVEKFWADIPGIYIRIEKLEEN